ncbi:hypothetical protein LJC32_01125 [Oscillospiraceae bacterium OttesenSCG-928-F05]|nr:hypothetical protein [Oscillospiraceae bacterium OttesenSCG-928-F05]
MQEELGYVISWADASSYYLPYALHIERNDHCEPWVYDDDTEAARAAEKDGIKLIYGMPGIDDGVYLDTPQNRRIIAESLKNYPSYYIHDRIILHPPNRKAKKNEDRQMR